MVPKGWSIESLGNVTNKVGSGVTPKGGSNSYKSSGVPLIRSQNVLWGKLDLSDVAYIDDKQHNKMKGSFVCKNDVLLNITGASIGRVAVSDIDEANVNQHVCIIRSEELNSEYLKSFLLSFQGQKQIEQCQAGGNRQGLNFEQIKSFKVPVPPLPEQQKIAKILSTWDKAISATERLIDNSSQQKKALMQRLLTGKKRLLDDEGQRFGGEWERLKLEDVVTKTQLGTSERTKDVEEISTIPLIKMGNLTWGGFSFDKLETLPKSKVDESLILKSGDFLFNTRNTPELVGKSAVWKEQKVQATFDNNINRITFNQNINTDFMCLYLTYGKGKSLISSLSAGSTSVAAIYWKDLKNIKLPVPTLSEQQKIATVLTTADKEIELLEQQLADLQQEKKALMQVLLTGKKRVVVDGEG
ncbi:restriction endonuclease subunit S [Psychrobacter sp. Ps2]|uniref:restriction endonuclease subunit S n=1 Tax=Psychrobacter sp. Ps2 TaxID=2790956 RepID=UPI001EE02A38|nr:restriction endonuclease subunit S [Psychrobacter sp. Ps2]MCG3857963.1 restriction endonuclease subunit S [Psychrobacter sp. Ps2]